MHFFLLSIFCSSVFSRFSLQLVFRFPLICSLKRATALRTPLSFGVGLLIVNTLFRRFCTHDNSSPYIALFYPSGNTLSYAKQASPFWIGNRITWRVFQRMKSWASTSRHQRIAGCFALVKIVLSFRERTCSFLGGIDLVKRAVFPL
jgi:hypothetical protein